MELCQILKPTRRIVSAGLIATTLAFPFSGCGTCQESPSAEVTADDILQYGQAYQTLQDISQGRHMWRSENLEINKYGGRRKVNFLQSDFLPEFYVGEYPFKYVELATAGSGTKRALSYHFNESSGLANQTTGFATVFVYNGFEFEGAVAIDDSLGLVAELRRYEDPTKRFFSDYNTTPSRRGKSNAADAVLMEEVHYTPDASSPDRIGFYCISEFKKSTGEKTYEFEITREGEKLKNFFFMIPPLIPPLQ